ncbi:MAG: hypothetical protein M9894_34975 [Planctomycetes bacterium]|nr:hypothetical protein [Planctomycetota bacterium]MCO5171535.1 hypothetical protein [Planctomycetota bacterium]MCW8138264.1 hypothetical protein [Planctomycetota bacterium]MCW8138287.1 hypothetical protein [Planctomycetota bacterium]
MSGRYGTYLFTCFDYPLLPPDTNDIERYFGATKAQLRHALGAASTAGSVAKNLGADYVEGFATAWLLPGEQLLQSLAPRANTDYDRAREEVRAAEQKATLRRSRRRAPARHISAILTEWLAAP